MDVSDRRDRIKQELASIADANGGMLRAEDVVSFAADATTALHGEFTWDDSEAARQYRIFQARQLIRVTVVYEPRINQDVRVYLSLPDDRQQDGGGYRRTVDVMADDDLRAQALASALRELESLRRKYATLQELFGVFIEVDKATATHKPRRKNQRKTLVGGS